MTEQAEHRGMALKTKVKIVVGIVLAILAVIIMFQNTEPISTQLLFWQVTLPHFVLLLLMLTIGLVLGMVALTMRRKRKTKEH